MADFRPIVGNILLGLLIFGMSSTVEFGHFKEQVKNFRAIATGCFLQFIVLPFLGFVVVKIANFEYYMGITLLIITSSPGGAYSNWFCSIFNADLALSVTMTAISTILSVAFLPFNVYVYSKATYSSEVLSSLDWTSLGISLAVVVVAITAGLVVSLKCSNSERGTKIRDLANKFGNLAGLGLILFTSLAPEGGRITLNGREPIFYYGTIMPIALGLFCSIIISTLARLKKPERVTVAVECVYQNTGIAMTSCLALFPDKDEQLQALGVPFWYTGMQTVFVGCFCLVSWKAGWTKAPANTWNIFKVLLTSYEVAEAQAELKNHEEEGKQIESNEPYVTDTKSTQRIETKDNVHANQSHVIPKDEETEAQDEDTWKDHEEIETATNIAGNDDWWSDFLKVTKVKK